MKACIDISTRRAGLIELAAKRAGEILIGTERRGLIKLAAKRAGEILIGTERRGGMTISSSFVCAVDHSGAIYFNSSEGYFFTSLGERIKILE